ncbi:NAD-dependent epimerase/dehydratase family protein [Planctobacterium marinum]|uniref:NAD-dependent epimerase/dehydratase family protein n=1 Tax=Planctobacterium marinum TaxID=1631968 RepID=UPI001E44F99E|nr:NAD-dependent epimerase/dehydratase family protein [Planctobacterium marinum]MCC2607938.1 NAD-dependent epimerase/dehydratase family protein [Planctobacterium marinum]
MKVALVTGAGGFIGSHLVTFLKSKGYRVIGADLKLPEFSVTTADEFKIGDLRSIEFVESLFSIPVDEVYQLAADMGGAGYLFTGENDADVMHNSVLINLNLLNVVTQKKVDKVFYSSSACIYPEYNQMDANNPNCTEGSEYPAAPDSEYGWEKLFSERLYLSYQRNYGLNVKIARFHNIFGPQGTFDGGREKVPAALARKVAMAQDGGEIEIWGDGTQTRSFLYIDDCVEAVFKLMQSDFSGPVNIGSSELISINALAKCFMRISGKQLTLKHVKGPIGVQGRNSDNRLIAEKLNWLPGIPLASGLEQTYQWIAQQVNARAGQTSELANQQKTA